MLKSGTKIHNMSHLTDSRVVSEKVFFSPKDIEDLPPNVQEKLFDEVLDRDVQKGEVFFFFSIYFIL